MSDTIPDSIPQKQCSKCKRLLPHASEYFNKHPKGPNGLHPQCRDCRKKAWALKHPPKPKTDKDPTKKQCTGCNEFLPATTEYFYPRQEHGGLIPKCKQCTSLERKERYQTDEAYQNKVLMAGKKFRQDYPEYNKRRLADYCKANPERYRVYNHNRGARKKDVPGTLTQQEIQQKLKAQHYRCYYGACGYAKFEKVNGQYVYHLEHTVPVSRTEAGPRHDINFVVLSCPTCNQSKHDKLPHEWPAGGRLF